VRIGYFLATEEFTPAELLAQAEAAERAGFHGLWISDHYHPWNVAQGQSPFVWSVLGALAKTTVTSDSSRPTRARYFRASHEASFRASLEA
jgi:Luciferase-like monooxygenase